MREYPKIINGIEVPYEKDLIELESMLALGMPHFTVACIALAYKGDISSLDLLGNLLSNQDWCKRRVAVEAIGYHDLGYLLSNKLISLLDDKSEYVIMTTIDTIRIHRINEAHESILNLIQSKNEEIKRVAIACLKLISKDDDFNLITQIFLKDKSKFVKDEAAYFIRERATEYNFELSVNLLKQSHLARHRVLACELISIFGDEKHLNILNELKNDKDGHVRKAANKIINKVHKE